MGHIPTRTTHHTQHTHHTHITHITHTRITHTHITHHTHTHTHITHITHTSLILQVVGPDSRRSAHQKLKTRSHTGVVERSFTCAFPVNTHKVNTLDFFSPFLFLLRISISYMYICNIFKEESFYHNITVHSHNAF